MTSKPRLGSLKVIGTDTYRSVTYDFLLTFHDNHGPISYRLRDKRRFWSKISNFPHPRRVFCVPAEGVPLGIGHRRLGSKKTRMMGLRSRENRFDDIFIHLDTIHQRDGRTGGRIDTGRQQRPRLRIAR